MNKSLINEIKSKYPDAIKQGAKIELELSLTEPDNCTLFKNLGVPIIDIYLIFKLVLNGVVLACYYIQV